LKTLTIVVFFIITGATGCNPWSKSSPDWTVSSGTANPNLSGSVSVASNDVAPLVIEEEKPTPETKTKTEMAMPKRKPGLHLGAQTQCSKGSDRRTLEVIFHGTGCRLAYQSSSHVETVAKATWGKKVCQQVRTHIVQKLKSAGYSCS
jgi:hypothetical protein